MDLKPGEIICNECKGSGEIYTEPFDDPLAHYYENCPKCKGNKKLDWIEQIVGVQKAKKRYHFKE